MQFKISSTKGPLQYCHGDLGQISYHSMVDPKNSSQLF